MTHEVLCHGLKAEAVTIFLEGSRMTLPSGKIPVDLLKEIIFKNLGTKRDEVALGPTAGIDGAVINFGSKSLIVSMDPITGAIEHIGWHAVKINANDVATFGVAPEFFLSCILLPENADKRTVEAICTQMDMAAKELSVAIIGGHCEVTPGLSSPIVIGCMIGTTDRGNYVTAGGAKSGDRLILTKSVGIEGTAILASDKEQQLKKAISPLTVEKAKNFFSQISVVKEATIAFTAGGVSAMHDPTEGGLAGGIHEMADASNLGVKIFQEKIRIQPETSEICKFFKIDPLQLISSGALLISCKPTFADKIVKKLEQKQIHASIIGEFVRKSSDRLLIQKNKKVQTLPRPLSDHLWIALR
jgi:hydrogenase maturation factor